MGILEIVLFVLFGLVIGLLARALIPGRQRMGLVLTTLLGIAGSLIGGLVASMMSRGDADGFSPAGFIGSLLGALLLLGLYVAVTRNRRTLAP